MTPRTPMLNASPQTSLPPAVAEWRDEALEYIYRRSSRSRERAPLECDAVSADVEAASIVLASALADANLSAPFIDYTSRGSIQIEWEKGPRYFELEVRGERSIDWYFHDRAAKLEEEGVITDPADLSEVTHRVQRVFAAQ